MKILSRPILRIALLPIFVGLIFSTSLFLTEPAPAEAGFSECVAAGLSGVGLTSVAKKLVTRPVPTNDSTGNALKSGDLAKECLLDGIAVQLRETLIRKITDSIVTWINSGFQGSPAFVQNFDQFISDTADEAFGEFIYNDENFGFLCSPFQFNVRFALALGYASRTSRPVCTLSEITDNVEGAIDNLSDQWDWDTFDVITTQESGNYFSSYVTASEDLDNLIEKVTGEKITDIKLGGGFLSDERCEGDPGYAGPPGERNDNSGGQTTVGGQDVIGGDDDRSRWFEREGKTCYISTPGSVINNQLNNALSSDLRRLELADELDEIFSALMGQLVKQVLGGGGISGLSQSNAGSQSFLDQYLEDAQSGQTETRSDIGGLMDNYVANAESAVEAAQEKIRLLLDVKTSVTSAYTCYESKYNTWVDGDGNVIDPLEVENVLEENRTRATFFRGSILGGDYELLTPAESLAKSQFQGDLLDQIDFDLEDSSNLITNNQEAVAAVAQYQIALSQTDDIFETQDIYSQFSSAIAGTGISTDTGVDQLAAVQAEIDEIMLGSITGYNSDTGQPIRSGGVTSELQRCQSFIQVAN